MRYGLLREVFQIHSRVANRVLEISKANKGIYLKFEQYLGNLDRVMPWEYTQMLKVLHMILILQFRINRSKL